MPSPVIPAIQSEDGAAVETKFEKSELLKPQDSTSSDISNCTEETVMDEDELEGMGVAAGVEEEQPEKDPVDNNNTATNNDAGSGETRRDNKNNVSETDNPMTASPSQTSIHENEEVSNEEAASQTKLQSTENLESSIRLEGDRPRRNSLLKKESSFVTPSGEHIEPKKVGRRLSFSDESGAKLCETAFSDKLHYSSGHSFIQATPLGGGGQPSKGCCTIS